MVVRWCELGDGRRRARGEVAASVLDTQPKWPCVTSDPEPVSSTSGGVRTPERGGRRSALGRQEPCTP